MIAEIAQDLGVLAAIVSAWVALYVFRRGRMDTLGDAIRRDIVAAFSTSRQSFSTFQSDVFVTLNGLFESQGHEATRVLGRALLFVRAEHEGAPAVPESLESDICQWVQHRIGPSALLVDPRQATFSAIQHVRSYLPVLSKYLHNIVGLVDAIYDVEFHPNYVSNYVIGTLRVLASAPNPPDSIDELRLEWRSAVFVNMTQYTVTVNNVDIINQAAFLLEWMLDFYLQCDNRDLWRLQRQERRVSMSRFEADTWSGTVSKIVQWRVSTDSLPSSQSKRIDHIRVNLLKSVAELDRLLAKPPKSSGAPVRQPAAAGQASV